MSQVSKTPQTPIDSGLDGPVFLLVTVEDHHACRCGRHSDPDRCFWGSAVYTWRVRHKAILSVYAGGTAMRWVADRLVRDSSVSSSEGMVRKLVLRICQVSECLRRLPGSGS